MKWTFKRFIFVVLELIFTAVVPLVIVYLGYGGWGAKAKRFKIYFRVVVAAVVVFLIVKRVFINPWLFKQRIKAGSLEAQIETENDAGKILNIEEALRRARITETVLNWVLPLAFLVVAFLACRALEKSIVTFTGIIGFIGLSESIGFVFAILESMCVKSRHRPKKEKKRRRRE